MLSIPVLVICSVGWHITLCYQPNGEENIVPIDAQTQNFPDTAGIKVCFVVCDNGFSQIFYNCSNVEEIFSRHN